MADGRPPFAGKTAVITGAASGIGRALAAELAAQGAHVVLTDIDAQGVERAARELAGPTDGGGSVVGRPLDVRDREAVHTLIGEVGRDGIDLVFNNAGLAMGGPTHELTGRTGTTSST
jgi:NAD(P)-dependent dehydrogenase (short-subunit alcohol dehydrogenase family)